MSDSKTCPIQRMRRGDTKIPWKVAEEAHKEYSERYSQSLGRIAQRGGFGSKEVIYLLYNRIRRLQGESPGSIEEI